MNKETKKTTIVPEANLDELRMDFDYMADHGLTKAKTFQTWLRNRGYRCGADGQWYFISK